MRSLPGQRNHTNTKLLRAMRPLLGNQLEKHLTLGRQVTRQTLLIIPSLKTNLGRDRNQHSTMNLNPPGVVLALPPPAILIPRAIRGIRNCRMDFTPQHLQTKIQPPNPLLHPQSTLQKPMLSSNSRRNLYQISHRAYRLL